MTNESISAAAAARALGDATDERDPDAMAALFRDDVVAELRLGHVVHGKQALRDEWAELFAAMPDSRFETINEFVDGDVVVVEWRWRGTFTGAPCFGLHATGDPFDVRGCDIMRFTDGLLAEDTSYVDGLGFARQIGMLPKEGTLADKATTTLFNAQTDAVAAGKKWWKKRQKS